MALRHYLSKVCSVMVSVISPMLVCAELLCTALISGHYTSYKENIYAVQNADPLLEGTCMLSYYLHAHQQDNYSSFT